MTRSPANRASALVAVAAGFIAGFAVTAAWLLETALESVP